MSATASLPVCQVIVVLPIAVPPGTGLGSARRTTPTTVALLSGAAGSAVESEEDGPPQPVIKRPATIRQSAAADEIALANSSFLSVSMHELIMLLAPRNNFFTSPHPLIENDPARLTFLWAFSSQCAW